MGKPTACQGGPGDLPGIVYCYWAHELIFFKAPEWLFTTAYCLFALLVVATFVLAPPRRPKQASIFTRRVD